MGSVLRTRRGANCPVALRAPIDVSDPDEWLKAQVDQWKSGFLVQKRLNLWQ